MFIFCIYNTFIIYAIFYRVLFYLQRRGSNGRRVSKPSTSPSTPSTYNYNRIFSLGHDTERVFHKVAITGPIDIFICFNYSSIVLIQREVKSERLRFQRSRTCERSSTTFLLVNMYYIE